MSQKIVFLILEDDVAIALTLKKEVERRGFMAYVAHNSKKARELVKEHGETITHGLFDIKLNRESIDGIQLATEFKQILPELVIIFVTSYLKDENILERIKQIGGNTQYVDKSDSEALDDVVPRQLLGTFTEQQTTFALQAKLIVLEMYQEYRWMIPVENILFIKGAGDRCKLVIQQGTEPQMLLVGMELKPFIAQFVALLPPQHTFWQVNRSLIINASRILRYSTGRAYFGSPKSHTYSDGTTEEIHYIAINQTVLSVLERNRFRTLQ